MSALTETTSTITEFAGDYKVAVVEVDGTTSTNDTVTIGEMSVVDNFPRSATAKARTETSFLTLTQKNFDEILKNHPEIGIKILKGISRLLSLNLRKTSSRLADYLLPVS